MQIELRGVPIWLLKEYLSELGGEEVEPDHMRGDGWQVTLVEGTPIEIGSLHIGRAVLAFEGEEGPLQEVVAGLRKKARRAGG